MATYLQRYLSGECETVWQELQALGEDVRTEPVYSDAVAVARETMRRARTNIETLSERLTALGYRFGFESERRGGDIVGERRLSDALTTPLLPPPADSAAQVRQIEEERGVLPIALRAFYEVVGAVDLRGYFPISGDGWGPHDADALDWSFSPVPATLDPLFVYPLTYPLTDEDEDESYLLVSQDPIGKMEYSAYGPMLLTIPCATMDASLWVEEPCEDNPPYYFVECLRRAFLFGGFNHLAAQSGDEAEVENFLRALRTPDGESYLHFLTHDLLDL